MRETELMTQLSVLDAEPAALLQTAHSQCGTGNVSATCVTTVSTLEQLSPDWKELYQRIGCRNPFLSVEWMTAWWRHWSDLNRLLIIAVRNSLGRLVAVAPFYIRRSRLGGWGPRALCFVGTHELIGAYHLNLLVDPEYEPLAIEAIVNLVKQHRAEWDYVELSLSDKTSPALGRLCDLLRCIGLSEKVIQTQTALCPYVELPSSFEEYLKSIGRNIRYNFRRRRRALEREGVEFVALREASELHEKFDELFHLHRLRFEHKQEHSSFLKPGVYEFHVDAMSRLAEARMAMLFLLQVRGKAIAALYGFSTGKTFSFYQAGMDPAWSRLSVGLVMMGCSIEEAIRSGHEEYDFLCGTNPYKLQWANKVRHDVMTCLFDCRARSQWARLRIGLIDRLRALKRQYSFRNTRRFEQDEPL